jgi:uncharacterized membrane protein YdbT with pleckstrin-like domain
MSYINRILQPGEQRLHTGRIHWVVYLPPLAVCLAALVLWIVALGRDSPGTVANLWFALAALCALVGLLWLAWAWFDTWITEIEITDRRVIYKRGFIFRRTSEMNMDKVESVDVDQSILGRLLDYGTVTIRGTGESQDPFKNVAAPLEFRNRITAR